MSLKVLICFQVQICAEGVWCLLEKAQNIKILGIACTDDEIENLLQYSPDVIVTDLPSCKKVLEKSTLREDKKVLLLNDTGDLNSENIKNMIANGLGGILSADADAKLLEKAIHKLHEGELWLEMP